MKQDLIDLGIEIEEEKKEDSNIFDKLKVRKDEIPIKTTNRSKTRMNLFIILNHDILLLLVGPVDT